MEARCPPSDPGTNDFEYELADFAPSFVAEKPAMAHTERARQED
jgi:hypothetical protein